jgi:UDP-N-acetylglucosamine diphosphorylase / glucose-1-phosphate thymidylyltransferase / UDP-N-acetylgalactosamine diphosphorylase / glucosamine-1-phosphate N-acetyltransferase / galactosamine-1-phosphate N-acetyltransferase
MPRTAVVLAGGRGVRFRPYSPRLPKPLFPLEGEPLLLRNIRLLDTAFDLDVIYVVVGFMKDEILRQVQEGTHTRARIDYVEVPDDLVAVGLLAGYAVMADRLAPGETFVSVLGDEFYGGGDHARFASFVAAHPAWSACIGIKRFQQPDEYFRNYAACMRPGGDEVERVVEKPDRILSDFFGLGFIAARQELCALASTELQRGTRVHLIDLLNALPGQGLGPVLGCEFTDLYVNINTPTDVYQALRLIRRQRAKDLTLDVIIPAWNEADSIPFVVKDFLPMCRQVVVMDNASPDGTAEIARAAGAKVYSEPLRGYGDAIRKGLDRSDADLLVVVEADGTFRAHSLARLVEYAMDADAVIGSRTYWQYVEYGANMPFLQRMGNMVFGAIITLLWWNRRSRFSDVGCSFRVIWQSTYRRIRDHLEGDGPEFAPEMVIELLNARQRVIEVPVPYHARVMGKSKFSKSILQSGRTAWRMLKVILSKRARGWVENLRGLLAG